MRFKGIGARIALLAPLATIVIIAAGDRSERATSSPSAETRQRVESKAAGGREQPRPFDAPDQAYSYYRKKRLGSSAAGGSSSFDSVRAYRMAEKRVGRMPRLRPAGGPDQATSTTSEDVWSGGRPRAGFVSSIAFDPDDLNIVYATYATFNGEHVWKSEDAGVTWSDLDGTGSGALPDLPVHSIVVDPSASRQIYLGTDLGVFISLDGGSTWAVEDSGLPPAVTEWISYAETPEGVRFLFAFTHGRGARRLRLPG